MADEEPCVDCPDKVIDDYGYFCDLSCGKRTAWLYYKAGQESVAKAVLAIIENPKQVNYRLKEITIYCETMLASQI